jgi:hypothetical protein
MIRYFCIRVGNWKVEDWHLYRWVSRRSVRDPKNRWNAWGRVL